MPPSVNSRISVGAMRSTSLPHTSNVMQDITQFRESFSKTLSQHSTHLISAMSFRFVKRDNTIPLTKSNGTTQPDFSRGLAGVDLNLDEELTKYLILSILAVCLVTIALRTWHLFAGHIRRVHCLHATVEQQGYWTYDGSWFHAWFKREVVYAPLGKKRHNREIQLSKAANYGTLPGRAHTILLSLYILSNVTYCAILPYGRQSTAQTVAQLRGRAGVLAVVNMIPLVLLAGRNNPFIPMMRISFDTFNLFHRWIGRIVLLETLIHVSAWYANYSAIHGVSHIFTSFSGSAFLSSGLVAAIAMALILVQSLSAVRHAFYEIFLHLHQVLALLVFVGVYIHLDIESLPARPFIRIVLMSWLVERLIRLIRILYLNIGYRRRQMTEVIIEALPGEACRITFQLPRSTTIRPGSHVYAYLPKFSYWMSHPFSVAWTNIETEPPTGPVDLDLFSDDRVSYLSHNTSNSSSRSEKSRSGHQMSHLRRLSMASPNYLERQAPRPSARWGYPMPPSSISLVAAARTGMTRNIYEAAKDAPNKTIFTSGFVEGPYAGHDDLSSYGTVVMFAGGAGITHHLVQIRHLLAGRAANTVATRKIVLAWSVRDLEALSWVAPWMDEILRMPGRREMLEVNLFVTRPRGKADYQSPSKSIKLKGERCDPGQLLDTVMRVKGGRCGAVFVSVCGPGAFADEVRKAVRERVYLGGVDMNEESFTW